MNHNCCLRCLTIVLLVLKLFEQPVIAADDNLLAYKLYQQGNYTQAGEIFTDPAWKGMALYRSSQWWRAAEAFLRADDALSAYNLGNCYVQLGYYALALDAYQRALSMEPTLLDAEHNAEIMRQLLTGNEDQQQQGGRQAKGEEIDRLETDSPQSDGGGSDTGEQEDTDSEQSTGESTDANDQHLASAEQAQNGNGGDSSDDSDNAQLPEGDGDGTAEGTPTDEPHDKGRPSGGADTDEPTIDSASAGIRTSLENAQATTQWLNRIQNDPQLFLQRRLKLEQKRRQAAGQSPPRGGSTW